MNQQEGYWWEPSKLTCELKTVKTLKMVKHFITTIFLKSSKAYRPRIRPWLLVLNLVAIGRKSFLEKCYVQGKSFEKIFLFLRFLQIQIYFRVEIIISRRLASSSWQSAENWRSYGQKTEKRHFRFLPITPQRVGLGSWIHRKRTFRKSLHRPRWLSQKIFFSRENNFGENLHVIFHAKILTSWSPPCVFRPFLTKLDPF
jgi:hypothetical protein